MTPKTRPLDGIRVLDLSRVLSGPFCSMWLADLGAEVVKIERPGEGDDTRAFGPPFLEGESAYFMSINRGKKSVTLDMKHNAAREILWRLVERSDVLVENFRPGALARLGFTEEALRARNPRLVVASISGYGQTGLAEHVEKPGYDLVIQGLSGIASLTGAPDGPPFKVGTSIADITAGMLCLVGVLTALYARERTGRGQCVDVSMLDGTVSLLTFQAGIYFASGKAPARMGNAHPTICPYEAFRASDGWFNLACGNDALFRAFCEAAHLPELARDPLFATNSHRVSNRARLIPALSALFATAPVQRWLDLCERAGVPAGPILGVDGALAHPQLRARDMLVEMAHPRAGQVTLLGTPIHFSETPAGPTSPPPTLGQHTEAVLSDLGFSAEEVASLRESGVV